MYLFPPIEGSPSGQSFQLSLRGDDGAATSLRCMPLITGQGMAAAATTC
jgi:hypothetical protein